MSVAKYKIITAPDRQQPTTQSICEVVLHIVYSFSGYQNWTKITENNNQLLKTFSVLNNLKKNLLTIFLLIVL